MAKTILTLSAAALALAGHLAAGGFWLQVGNPEASAEARKANAVVTVKVVGCQDPVTATVSATATGMVQGQTKTIPLELTRLNETGMYAIAQQWPKEGKWLIQVVGRSKELFTNTLIAAGPEGVDRLHAKSDMKAFARADVESMLR